ncbi:MAG: hypothetical protein K6G73_11645 [Marinilabiliaceae bacterium]|nr:hypothetical protein [Marinilabiliaceae bacterium]
MSKRNKFVLASVAVFLVITITYTLLCDSNNLLITAIIILAILCIVAFVHLTRFSRKLKDLGISSIKWYSPELLLLILYVVMLIAGLILIYTDSIPTILTPQEQMIRDVYVNNGTKVDVIIVGQYDATNSFDDTSQQTIVQYINSEGNVVDAIVEMAANTSLTDNYERISAYVLPNNPNVVYIMVEDTRLDTTGYCLCLSAMLLLIITLVIHHRQVYKTEQQIEVL